MSKRLLITGFDPFGSNSINPSWIAVNMLPEQIENYMLCKLQIPTVFGKAAALVLEKAAEFKPDLILCIGLAVGRDAVTPERIGVNIRDARIPDNEGNQPVGERIIADGQLPIFQPSPWRKWPKPYTIHKFPLRFPIQPVPLFATMCYTRFCIIMKEQRCRLVLFTFPTFRGQAVRLSLWRK